MYSREEIQEIQLVLASVRILDNGERELLENLVNTRSSEELEDMNPLVPLLVTNKPLYERLAKDYIVRQYQGMPFFDDTYPLFYESKNKPEVFEVADAGEQLEKRVQVVCIKHPKKNLIMKTQKSAGEPAIAKKAAELGIGPLQYKAIPGVILEEYLDGHRIAAADGWPEPQRKEFVEYTGTCLGKILDLLHHEGIVYNNVVLADIQGIGELRDGHLVFVKQKLPRLIDFGFSFYAKNPKDYTNDDVVKFALMDADYKTFCLADPVGLDREGIVKRYRKKLEKLGKEKVLHIDVHQVLGMLPFLNKTEQKRLDKIFTEAFKKTYTLPF